MTPIIRTILRCAAVVLIAFIGGALAQDYASDWYTVDGGGEMGSTGGDYELAGTIGQPDAGAMSGTGPGGTYTLTAGFWAIPPCWCLSDINNDGLRNGTDVRGFVDCLVAVGANCACADLQADGVLDMNDVGVFVADLLAGGGCP